MTIRLTFLFSAIILLALASSAFGQIDSVIGQVTSSSTESYVGGMSGNGRFIVFESTGNLATENPRNADGNFEIFLFDYAQRRIFQITDTKSVLFNPSLAATQDNVRIAIVNSRPVISNDGRWIAFSSNATTSRPAAPNATNPGSFDGNTYTSPTPTPTATPTGTPTPTPTGSPTPTPTPPANPLTADGNTEIWLYQIPAYSSVADLSAGDEIPFTELSGGTFIPVTNTDASQTPRSGTASLGPSIADDNHDASISDNGNVLAFGSTRDLVPSIGNAFPAEDTEEIFTFIRGTNSLNQVTKTPRGAVSNPIYNKNPTISGNGLRVSFTSTGNNPIVGMTGGNNPDTSRNEEIFFSDLDATGAPAGIKKQVTVTTPTNPGDPVNIYDLGRRMSRDGRYIAFDSYADLANENSGTNYTSFALYLHDTTSNTTRRIGARSDADTTASGGDVAHYPGFTDYNANGSPATLVLQNRMNIKADGTVAATEADGLNPNSVRPSQIYSYPLNLPAATATFTRLAKFPTPNSFVASTQLMPSNSLSRMAFTLGLSELGLGNPDNLAEVYYFLKPTVTNEAPVSLSFSTGASRLPILATASPSPTPSGTATPTPTPTATPTATPTPTPTGSPTPTPTPVTPAAVLGMATGMLAYLDYQSGGDQPLVARTATGSLKRRFNLPMELSGLTMTINGVACGLKAVGQRRIEFVLPPALVSFTAGNVMPLVLNNNGVVMKGWVTIVPGRPDIFRADMLIASGGRAKTFNVTNTVFRTEPYPVRTIKIKGNRLVPTVLRVYLTGMELVASSVITVRIKDQVISGSNIKTGGTLVDPGIYTVDFDLPASLDGAGDSPIVVSVFVEGVSFDSRLDDTSTRVLIL